METLGILGAGKLGLCLALNIASNKKNVLICEKSESRINSIKSKKIDTIEPGVNELLSNISFTFHDLESFLEFCTIAFITVRTEGNIDGSYDCKQVYKLFDSIAKIKSEKSYKGKILIINCNVNPGTVEDCQKKVEHLGLIVAYSPEWVAQGSILKDQTNPDVLVIGHSDPEVQERILNVYKIFLKTIRLFINYHQNQQK